MSSVMGWVANESLAVLVPVIIFCVTLVLTFWLRKLVYDYLKTWVPGDKWKANEKIIEALRGPSAIWCLFLSIFLALFISNIPAEYKDIISRIMWTLLLVSLAIPLLNIVNSAILFYGQSLSVVKNAIIFARNIVRVMILFVAVMIALEIWGVSTNTYLLFLVVTVLAVILAFRDAFPNFFAGIQMTANQQIQVGDYIKLEGGEEGYITRIGWNNTFLQTLGESTVIVPNNHLLQRIVINCGRPLKKASEPFQFNTRKILKDPVGLKAKNLVEMVEFLKTIPDDVLFCHTYRCLEEDPYLKLEDANDFATWVKDVLGDRVLAKRLVSIHTNGSADLQSLRSNLITVIKEHLSSQPAVEDVPSGREFYFIKATSVISPTHYLAHDLREFAEALRKVTLDSIYFHFLGSKLRLRNGMNDFSTWLEDSLEEAELGREINQINPYNYNPEDFRSELIRSIEKHIK